MQGVGVITFWLVYKKLRQYHFSTTILPWCESANGNAFCKTLGTCVCDNGSTNKGPVNRPKLKQKCRAWMYGPDLRPQKSKQITFPPRKNKNWTRRWNLRLYKKKCNNRPSLRLYNLVNDRNHYFGFGPIPILKPKPKLVDSFGIYRNRYRNHISKGKSSYQ